MWLGTKDILNQYDGRNFIFYKNNFFDSNTISDAYVTKLLEDSRVDICTGLLSGDNNGFDRETGIFCAISIGRERDDIVATNEITDYVEVPLIF